MNASAPISRQLPGIGAFINQCTSLGSVFRSKKDWTLVRRAVEDGYVIVTNNATDFTPLVGREEVHAGLVCLNVVPDRMSLEVQKDLFEYALDQLANEEPINEVLEITLTAHGIIRAARYEWPSCP